MNRTLIIGLVVLLLFGTGALFAQVNAELPEPVLYGNWDADVSVSTRSTLSFSEQNDALSFLWNFGYSDDYAHTEYFPSMTIAQAASSDVIIPVSIRNNRYFLESVRLNNLANLSYEEGDYDASSGYSEEAVRYAQLSDDYVQLQLKIRETDNAIAAARRRLDYAASVNAPTRFPTEYATAQSAYNDARNFRTGEQWDDAIDAANRVLVALSNVEREPDAVTPAPSGAPPLPAQYTVRAWSVSKDCLWNIAGRPWAYNDPNQWRVIYNANRSRMPQPDNPDLIHPDMVLDIPSIKGETRQGMWDSTATYTPLQ